MPLFKSPIAYGGIAGSVGGTIQAQTVSVNVAAATAGLLATVSTQALIAKLVAPITYAKTSGNANLTINSTTGGISATAGIAAGATQSLVGTATGADGCVIPFTANLTGAVVAPTLSALTLSASAATVGTPATININGATAGSTITGTPPDGMTLNSAARTITGTPTIAGTYNFALVETLAGATGSPKSTNLTMTVAAASSAANLMLIVAGQSNSRSAGVAGSSDVPAEWTALSSADKARVRTWDHANTQWVAYDPATNAELLAATFAGTTVQKWGPETMFAVSWLADNPGKTLYLVKYGKNGTGLDPSITQPNWYPSTGTLYNDTKTYAQAARANLDAASVTYNQARLWMQGEADATPATGSATGTAFTATSNYQSNLTALESNSRTDWCGGASAPLIVGRIQALDYPNTVTVTDATNNRVDCAYAVRAAQLAAADASSGRIKVVDLDTGLGGQPVLHPGPAWVKDMGQRMYAAFAGTYNAIYGDIHDTTPDTVTFADKTGQTASSVIASDLVTVTGLKARAPISVGSGVEYRIILADNTIISGNSQVVYRDWGSAASTIENGQKLQLRMTSSATAGATVSGTVTIGGVTSTFNVVTTSSTALPGNTRSNALEAKMAAVGAAAFNTTQHNAVVTFFSSIGSLLDAGKIKVLAVPAVHDELLARIRWDDQTTVATKAGTVGWGATTGYNPNAASNTYVDFGSDLSTVSQNGLGIGVYTKAVTTSTSFDVQLNNTPLGLRLLGDGAGDVTPRAALNGGNANHGAVAFSPGLWAAQRISSTTVRFYSGGSPIATDVSSTSTTPANLFTRIGGNASANRAIGALVITDGFADADWSAFNTALVTLLTAFGSN